MACPLIQVACPASCICSPWRGGLQHNTPQEYNPSAQGRKPRSKAFCMILGLHRWLHFCLCLISHAQSIPPLWMQRVELVKRGLIEEASKGEWWEVSEIWSEFGWKIKSGSLFLCEKLYAITDRWYSHNRICSLLRIRLAYKRRNPPAEYYRHLYNNGVPSSFINNTALCATETNVYSSAGA